MKNWKTTAAGVVLALISFATYMDWINASQASMISTILTAVGFSLAKDSGVSGKEW